MHSLIKWRLFKLFFFFFWIHFFSLQQTEDGQILPRWSNTNTVQILWFWKACAVFVNSHIGQCFTASALICICAFVNMAATRWKPVVLLFSLVVQWSLKGRVIFCPTASRNWAALLSCSQFNGPHVWKNTPRENHSQSTWGFIHLVFVLAAAATAPWPSTGPEPRWPPAGRCPPAAGRSLSARAFDGPLPH